MLSTPEINGPAYIFISFWWLFLILVRGKDCILGMENCTYLLYLGGSGHRELQSKPKKRGNVDRPNPKLNKKIKSQE